MSGRDDRSTGAAETTEDEPFFSRWVRRKKESRESGLTGEAAPAAERPAEQVSGPGAGGEEREAVATGDGETAASDGAAVPPLELPPLETLTAESDFGAFMQPGVDGALRRAALRKMFRNPIYGTVDELDPFRADFAAFTPLGDTITSDMKFHAERLLREQLEKAAESTEGAGTATPEADQTATASIDESEPQEPDVAPEVAADDDRVAADDSTIPTEHTDERRDH
jgi:hypothetical protein